MCDKSVSRYGRKRIPSFKNKAYQYAYYEELEWCNVATPEHYSIFDFLSNNFKYNFEYCHYGYPTPKYRPESEWSIVAGINWLLVELPDDDEDIE